MTLGDPSPQANAQIRGAMQQAKELFGVTADVVAFSDPSSDYINGMETGGRQDHRYRGGGRNHLLMVSNELEIR